MKLTRRELMVMGAGAFAATALVGAPALAMTDDMIAAVEKAKADIISGDLEVVAYYANDSCPVLDF